MEATNPVKTWNHGQFAVRGVLNFHSRDVNFDPEAGVLCKLIREIDSENPWVHISTTGHELPSIGYMSNEKKEKVRSPLTRMRTRITIHISPCTDLTSAQLFAYNRYLNYLAEKLVGHDVLGLHEVNCYLEIVGPGTTYSK